MQRQHSGLGGTSTDGIVIHVQGHTSMDERIRG